MSLTAQYGFANDFTLTSITGYRTSDTLFGRDFDGVAADLMFFDISVDDEQFTQELRLASPRLGAFDFVAGLYYYDQGIDSDQALRVGADWAQIAPIIGRPLFPYGFPSTRQFGTLDTTAYAAFANVNWHLGESFTLNAGARYTREDKKFVFNQASNNAVVSEHPQLSRQLRAERCLAHGQLAVSLQQGREFHATASRGFKSGGWNADFVTTTDLDFDDETATNYELGMKSSFLDGRFNAELSVFRLDYRDLQVNLAVPIGGGVFANVTTERRQGDQRRCRAGTQRSADERSDALGQSRLHGCHSTTSTWSAGPLCRATRCPSRRSGPAVPPWTTRGRSAVATRKDSSVSTMDIVPSRSPSAQQQSPVDDHRHPAAGRACRLQAQLVEVASLRTESARRRQRASRQPGTVHDGRPGARCNRQTRTYGVPRTGRFA